MNEQATTINEMDPPGTNQESKKRTRRHRRHRAGQREDSEVEVIVVFLSLTENGKVVFNQQYPDEKWKIGLGMQFMTNPMTYTPLKTCDNLTYDFTTTYKVDAEDAFFDTMETEMVAFELVGHCGGIFATGEVSLREMLDTPRKKLYNHVNLYGKSESRSKGILYGTLTIAYRFNCTNEAMEAYKTKKAYIDPNWEPPKTSKYYDIIKKKCPSDGPATGRESPSQSCDQEGPEFSRKSAESSPNSLSQNLSACNTDRAWETESNLSADLHKTVSWLEEEANWQRTLQEYAILTGQNPKLVEWRQWRDIHSTKVKMRNYQDNYTEYQPLIVIELHSLKLFQISPPMNNDTIKQLFIEYSFLTYEDEELETPFSLAKPQKGNQLNFCFRKEFPIELDKNKEDCILLGELIKTGDVITFNVVSEPLVEELQQYQTCEPIGYAELKLRDLIMEDKNFIVNTLLVKDVNEPHDEIGVIKLTVSGIQAMRKVALDVLTPDDFKFE